MARVKGLRLTGTVLDVRAAAEELGYSEEYVRRLCRSGALKTYRVGTGYLFLLGDLQATVAGWRARDAGQLAAFDEGGQATAEAQGWSPTLGIGRDTTR